MVFEMEAFASLFVIFKKICFENHEMIMKRLPKHHIIYCQKTIQKPFFAKRAQTFSYCTKLRLFVSAHIAKHHPSFFSLFAMMYRAALVVNKRTVT